MSLTWVKNKPFFTLLSFLCISLFIMAFYGRGLDQRAMVDQVILEILSPFHRAANSLVDLIDRTWDGYVQLVGTKKENQRLKKRMAELESLNTLFQELGKENQRLKDLLEFRKDLPSEIISAQIIGKDTTSWFQSILLNKGADSGVKANQPVVTSKGLVGKVMRTTMSTALVELITDKNSRVAAMVQKNRTEAILRGQSSPICVMDYLDRDADIEVGDYVISSGMGGIFPKGLMLGIITKVERESYGLFQYAEVTPQVPFSMLEEVLILKTEEKR